MRLWYYGEIIEASLFVVDDLEDSGSGSIEFGSEELLGDDALSDARSVTIERLFLRLLLLPSDLLEAEVHDFGVETQALSDVHIKLYQLTMNSPFICAMIIRPH